MNLLKIKKVDRKTYQVNDCKLVKRTTEDLGFSTEYIWYERKNLIGFEYCWNYWIRIDAIRVESEAVLVKLLDALKLLAVSRGYKLIRFADHIEPEIIEMMKSYGFVQENVPGDEYNIYLYLQISEEIAAEDDTAEKEKVEEDDI